jgi:hypothetical protein
MLNAFFFSSMHATCSGYFILHHFILVISCEEYKLWSSHFTLLKSKYSPQHLVLKHSQSIFLV